MQKNNPPDFEYDLIQELNFWIMASESLLNEKKLRLESLKINIKALENQVKSMKKLLKERETKCKNLKGA